MDAQIAFHVFNSNLWSSTSFQTISNIYMKLQPKYHFIFVMATVPTFMGYATMFNLQRYIKESLYIQSNIFSIAYAFLYMGNLLFRFFHNYIWVFTSPFWRVIISYSGMILVETLQIIAVLVPWDESKNNSWLGFLIYFFGGLSIGTVESNILNVVAQISHKARQFAVLGIPIGCNIITIFSFLIIEAAVAAGTLTDHQVCAVLFGITIALLLASIIILCLFVPHGPFLTRRASKAKAKPTTKHYDDDSQSNSSFLEGEQQNTGDNQDNMPSEDDETTSLTYMPRAFKCYREWLLPILPNSIAMFGNMFSVAQFSPGITLYTINNSATVKFFGGHLQAGYFRSIQGTFSLVGDIIARVVFERVGYIFPPALLLISLTGVLCTISGITELLCLASMLIMFVNGALYIQTSKYVREITMNNHWGLAGYSFWLFVGDFGSLIASFTQQQIAISVCTDLKSKVWNGQPGQWDPCPYY